MVSAQISPADASEAPPLTSENPNSSRSPAPAWAPRWGPAQGPAWGWAGAGTMRRSRHRATAASAAAARLAATSAVMTPSRPASAASSAALPATSASGSNTSPIRANGRIVRKPWVAASAESVKVAAGSASAAARSGGSRPASWNTARASHGAAKCRPSASTTATAVVRPIPSRTVARSASGSPSARWTATKRVSPERKPLSDSSPSSDRNANACAYRPTSSVPSRHASSIVAPSAATWPHTCPSRLRPPPLAIPRISLVVSAPPPAARAAAVAVAPASPPGPRRGSAALPPPPQAARAFRLCTRLRAGREGHAGAALPGGRARGGAAAWPRLQFRATGGAGGQLGPHVGSGLDLRLGLRGGRRTAGEQLQQQHDPHGQEQPRPGRRPGLAEHLRHQGHAPRLPQAHDGGRVRRGELRPRLVQALLHEVELLGGLLLAVHQALVGGDPGDQRAQLALLGADGRAQRRRRRGVAVGLALRLLRLDLVELVGHDHAGGMVEGGQLGVGRGHRLGRLGDGPLGQPHRRLEQEADRARGHRAGDRSGLGAARRLVADLDQARPADRRGGQPGLDP